jgi:hypothetical protein
MDMCISYDPYVSGAKVRKDWIGHGGRVFGQQIVVTDK